MKRCLIFVFALVLVSAAAFGETRTLIDFTTLTDEAVEVQIGSKTQHEPSLVDFAEQAGASYTAEEKAEMKTSLALEEWGVELASSSRTVGNMAKSITKEVSSRTYGQVLGIRVKFPTGAYNSYLGDAEGDGWFFKMKLSDTSQVAALMDEAAYKAFIDD